MNLADQLNQASERMCKLLERAEGSLRDQTCLIEDLQEDNAALRRAKDREAYLVQPGQELAREVPHEG